MVPTLGTCMYKQLFELCSVHGFLFFLFLSSFSNYRNRRIERTCFAPHIVAWWPKAKNTLTLFKRGI